MFYRILRAMAVMLLAIPLWHGAAAPAWGGDWDDLNKQFTVLREAGKYNEAEPVARQMLDLANHEDNQVRVAAALGFLGVVADDQARYTEAESLNKRSLELWEKLKGSENNIVAEVRYNLADVYLKEGRYAEAEPLLQKSLSIRQKVLGPEHADVAQSLCGLAVLLYRQGRYEKSEALYKQALVIYEKVVGPNHPLTAMVLDNLASVYDDEGRHSEAEPLYKRALAIRERTLGPDHPLVAGNLNNLAELYREQGRYAEAEPLYQRSLKMKEKTLGPDHPDLASSLNNLAVLYYDQDKYAQAEPLYQRALKIHEAALGPDHPDVASSLNNLAVLYHRQDKYAQAEPLYQRALKIREAALGPDHPDVAHSYDNLSLLQAALKQWSQAVTYEDQARRVIRRHVGRVLPALSAKDQLTFLQVTDSSPFHAALSLGLARREDPTIAAASSAWLANGKAVAQEALTQSMVLARVSGDSQVAARVKELLEIRRRLATLVMAGAQAGKEKQRKDQIDQLERQEEELVRGMARSTGQTARSDPWIETAALRQAIPADGILIDIARFNFRNFEGNGKSDKWQPARYAAWLVPPAGKGEIKIIDLGAANKIEETVQAVHSAMQRAMGSGNEQGEIAKQGEGEAEKLIQQPLADLTKLILKPLQEVIPGDTKQIILSPDAALWLVPWSALPTGDDKYTIEKYQIRYVVSGRDLVARQGSTKQNPMPPAVFANPDYDLGPSQVESATRSVLRGATAQGTETINTELRSLSGGKSASALPKVGRLPGTATEAAAIKTKLASYAHQAPVTYLDQYATEGIFKALRRPQVLVLSTHGFFLPDQEVQHDERDALLERANQRSVPVLTVDGKPVENPLLRCGLLLAGCNKNGDDPSSRPSPQGRASQSTSDDGILTGMEIVGTDLRGTELVVLSACETGLGQVRNGEGVAGLRQAFQLAGAKSVIATLWQIPDKDSAQLMGKFFTNLAAGQSKSAALRNAQLAQIEAHRQRFAAAHPFFWAAFTITGE